LEIAERNSLEEERQRLADDLKRERERFEQLEHEYLAVQREAERLAAQRTAQGRGAGPRRTGSLALSGNDLTYELPKTLESKKLVVLPGKN
jgi:hypothetical protein